MKTLVCRPNLNSVHKQHAKLPTQTHTHTHTKKNATQIGFKTNTANNKRYTLFTMINTKIAIPIFYQVWQ